MGDATPDRAQRLPHRAPRDADAAQEEPVRPVVETLSHPEGFATADHTGSSKQGTHSVALKRPHTGTVGQEARRPVGVFRVCVTSGGRTFLDRRPDRPRERRDDPQGRREARVPEEVEFWTPPESATEMRIHCAGPRGMKAMRTRPSSERSSGHSKVQRRAGGLGRHPGMDGTACR